MSDIEKSASSPKDVQYVRGDDSVSDFQELKVTEVQRNLKARHISMIALGGTIGTGLFISTKGPIAAGPVMALISYLFIATLAYSITQSLGEMATYIPCSGSFTQFATRFGSPALGCANGWMYWFSWAITFSLEISVIGQIIEYWTYDVPLAVWISVFWVLITCSNMVPVKFYGEIEFWVSSIKIIAVVGWLIYALCMVCGAGVTGPVGFRYWRNPGPWGDGGEFTQYVNNINTARFLNWLNSLISALFTFQGVELVGVSCGESANPRKTVPAAIKKVIWRIGIFYIMSIFFMGLLVPYNDPKLDSESSFASSSPFLIAIQNSGTPVLPDIFNAVILLAIISAANSNVYSGSRILYGLAQSGVAPKFFCKVTKHGIPYIAVLFTAVFGSLGYLTLSKGGNTVFDWLLNITAVAGLITWVNISFSHIRFMNVLKSRNISRDKLPFKAMWMPWCAYYGFGLGFTLVFVQGFSSFYGFTASNFFTAYISVILYVVIWCVAHFYYNGLNKNAFTMRSLLTPLDEIDIDTGVREIDDMVWEDEAPTTFLGKVWGLLS
ncbi:arginine permease [Metschnikowia bicuspidata var. bicuspidata NRRL YB-4993]|uniref:Arginine permease n=1 Tax=Metschnikowia bicuspidata var. bicuspidata NRRL YB-4993 TaxID=869754 RepID=A0A1A0HIH7_9ASCO|nr:arginine permease [Metschnikowia bicuspidata var. bicuspidata NRRL YB-4993]OBA23643.1 arginine permease [Metschnikowia bicuspidata var. bicuspidata NRRL YB-4993]